MMFKKFIQLQNKCYFHTTISSLSNSNKNACHSSNKMKSWHIHSYGELNNLQFSDQIRSPIISNPEHILVEVHAASINPIDIAIMGGYGSKFFNSYRQYNQCLLTESIEFPLILGRDFSGKILAKGKNVSHLKEGDFVWGVVPPTSQGCHAERVIAHQNNVSKMPENINYIQAASILYTGITAWSSLKISGGLYNTNATNKKVLVLGASGGVGSIAIQLLKAWQAKVTATCSNDAIPLLDSFDIDHILDYSDPLFKEELNQLGKFDIILDCAGLGSNGINEFGQYLKEWNCSKYITLKSPILKNMDNYGLIPGTMKSFIDLLISNLNEIRNTNTVRWAYFIPSKLAIQELSTLVQQGKLKPFIQEVYPFSNTPKAYARVSSGHLRGKIIIDMKKQENEN